MKIRLSLKKALIANFVLLALVPVLIVGLISFYFLRRDQLADISTANKSLAQAVADKVGSHLHEPLGLFRLGREMIEQRGVADKIPLEGILINELRKSDIFDAVFLLDRQGRVRQSANGHPPDAFLADMAGGDLSQLEVFQEAVRFGTHRWSEVYRSPLTGEPTVALAFPLMRGVLFGNLNLKEMLSAAGLVQGSSHVRVIIASREGIVLAHPDHSFVAKQVDLGSLNIVREGMRGGSGTFRYTVQGEEKLGSVVTIPETGWLVIAEQDVGKAFASIRRLEMVFIVGMLATMVLALTNAFWSLNRILFPLEALVRKVKEVAGGNYEQVPLPASFSEINELSGHVQTMAGAVQEREAELAERNEELAMTEEELRQQVDEYQAVHDALHTSNQTLQALFTAAPLAVISYDLEGRVILWNPAAEQVFGWSAAEVEGKENPVVPATGANEFWVLREMALAGKSLSNIELTRLRRDGSTIDVSFALAPLYGPYGKVSGIMTVCGDITERKRVEASLRKMRDVFVYTRMGVAVSDQSGMNLEIVNPAYVEMLGYQEGELQGKPIAEMIAPEYRGRFSEYVTAINERGHHVFETTLVRKDGRLFPAMIDATAVRDESGKFIYRVANVQDITERKRAEEEIRRLNAELEERVQERTRQLEYVNSELESFSYSVSHDLRAPLRHIDGYGQVLMDGYARLLDSRGQDYLQRMQGAARRMGLLIDDLLNLSRVSRVSIEKRVVDLSAIATAIAEELRTSQDGRQVHFVVAKGAVAHGDPGLLRVVLENLLGNAWKYTGKKQDAVIEFGAAEIDAWQTFFVRDNGAGFDMAYADKLFGPFQRLHGAEFEGTGVGLATVQRIVHRHGGRVWAESEIGSGATFWFTLS